MAQVALNVRGKKIGLRNWEHGILYDRLTITSTTTNLKFFQTPVGGTKTYLYTNLSQAGQLSKGERMIVEAIRFDLVSAVTLADAKLITDGAYFEFWVSTRQILQAPIRYFPAGTGLSGAHTTTATATTLSNVSLGSPDRTAITKLKVPIEITEIENFRVELFIPTALSGLSASTDIYCVLEGMRARPL